MDSGSGCHAGIEIELPFACQRVEQEQRENSSQQEMQNTELFDIITSTQHQNDQQEPEHITELIDDVNEEAAHDDAQGSCDSDSEEEDTTEQGEEEQGEAVVNHEDSHDYQQNNTLDKDDSEEEEKGNEEGEWMSFEVPQPDEDIEEFKVQYSDSINHMSLSSEDSTTRQQLDEVPEQEVSFDSSSPSAQLQIAVQQNNVQRKTIKQLQNALINLQEDCAIYEQKFLQVRQEGEKIYMTLFAKAARVKELAKKNESLEAICSMKDQMIFNQKLHIDEYKMTANSKTLELIEWQTRFDHANEGYQQALIDIDNKHTENSQLVDRIEELEKALDIQRGLRESSHTVAQANVQVLADKDSEILSLTQKLNDATRELMSLVAYLEDKGYSSSPVERKEASKDVGSLEVLLEAQRVRIAELEEQLIAKDTDFRAAEVVAAEVAGRCCQKEKEIEQLQSEVQKVVGEVVKVTASADELGQNFHAQLAKAQEDIAMRDAEIATLSASLEQLARPTAPTDEDVEMESDTAYEQRNAKNGEVEQLMVELKQSRDELAKLDEEATRVRDALATMEADAEHERANFRTEREELSKVMKQTEEDKQTEIAALMIKLQLATEMKEMKIAAAAPPVKQVCNAEIQTDPVSSSYRRVSGQQSNSVLMEQLEAIQISNELLRGDNASVQKRIDKMQEAQATMQVKVREAEAKADRLVAQIKAIKEDEEQQRNLLIFEHTEDKTKLEMTIQELLEKQNSTMEDQETVAEAKVAIERERTLRAKLNEQTSINQNLQNDLRLLYLKHKKDLVEVQEEYKHEQYKQRYLQVVTDRNSMKKELDALYKVMNGISSIQAKGGLIESIKENVNTMNQQYQASGIKLNQLTAFQASCSETAAKNKKLQKLLDDQKAETQQLIDEKAADALTWNVRRTEWESLCAKIAIERDALKTDNERTATISSRFEGMLRTASEEIQTLTLKVAKLKDDNAKLQETVDFLEVQITSHEETVAQLETQLRESQEQFAIKVGEVTAAREELTSTATALEIAREEVEKITHEYKSLHVKMILDSVVNNAEKAVRSRNEMILNERVNQLNTAITKYETMVQQQQDETLIALTAEVSQLNTEVTKLSQEVAKQTGEALKWSRAHKELSEFVEDERTIKDEQLQESEDRSRDLDARLQDQTKQIADLLAEKHTLEYELKLLHETVEEVQQEVEDGKKDLLAAQEETHRISEERDSLLDNVTMCTKSAAGLQETFDRRYEEMLQAKKQFEDAVNAKLAEEQERAKNVERELHEKLQSADKEKETSGSKVSEIEAQLADSELRFNRKSDLVQSLQDELAVFAECLKQKEKVVEDLSAKLQALLQANTQKETELSVQENEMAMKVSQLQSELEIARSQSTQLQTENVRLKKNVSEVTAQSMAVNSRHLDSATKLRESIAQFSEKAEKSAKDLEASETALGEIRKAKVALEQANAELIEKLATTEKSKQVNVELDRQIEKLTDELKLKSSKLEEVCAKQIACGNANNTLTTKLKELAAEKVSLEQDLAVLHDNVAKQKARIAAFEATAAKDKEKIEQLHQSSSTSMANETKLESELRKAVGNIKALRNEKEKLASQLELCLSNSNDQEYSAILRVKFSLEREVVSLKALNDSGKQEKTRVIDELSHYKASVARFKDRTEEKMRVQLANLQKAEEEVSTLDSCLKQLRTLLDRHEPLFSRPSSPPDLSQLYSRLISVMGQTPQPSN